MENLLLRRMHLCTVKIFETFSSVVGLILSIRINLLWWFATNILMVTFKDTATPLKKTLNDVTQVTFFVAFFLFKPYRRGLDWRSHTNRRSNTGYKFSTKAKSIKTATTEEKTERPCCILTAKEKKNSPATEC